MKTLGFSRLQKQKSGGPEGELSASLRYLNMRYTMPTGKAKGVLTDIGTEELAHMEIVATLVYKLLEGASVEAIKAADLGAHYADHGKSLYWENAAGVPWVAAYVSATGDPVADLHENLAAEQKARAVYENLLCLTDDPCVKDVLCWLREREIVHFQRFGETLMEVQDFCKQKKFY
ncbi:manganese catalase family protein [Desulforamulus ruminis]|uniref:Manganese containing catalase n=1 Tax=Desulforamulus ruminis (strain ATCC 23193 / DSM 2154 / NCIMB 8452 / DL) TaxID=696281 RepID=F6DTB2_DESRL|nr:manganese catalase family protein [Desulforamulus ruminis]AEG58929.1 manganese containing catalase [Desulforamulus ruminis DSM 2154]